MKYYVSIINDNIIGIGRSERLAIDDAKTIIKKNGWALPIEAAEVLECSFETYNTIIYKNILSLDKSKWEIRDGVVVLRC